MIKVDMYEFRDIFSKFPEVKLAYLFGSQVQGKAGRLSDYDFALYIDEKTNAKRKKDVVLQIIVDLSKKLKTDKIDLALLDKQAYPLLKYNVIKEGVLIYEIEPYQILIETQILNEYLDFTTFANIYK